MNNKRTFFGIATKGRFMHRDPDGFELYMIQFEDGKEMQIEIKPFSKRRTSKQPGEITNFNGYYWKFIVRAVADEMGELNQDYVHGLIQVSTGNFKVSSKGDKIILGTNKMTGSEFADYCSRARMWASQELGLFIAEPNQTEGYYDL